MAILYSRSSLLLGDMEGQHLGRQKDSLLSLWGCYRALLESHAPADFIDVDELKAGSAADYVCSIFPIAMPSMPRPAQPSDQFVEAGRDGVGRRPVGLEEPVWRLAPAAPMEMTPLFGFELHDIEATEQPFSLADHSDSGGGAAARGV